MLSDLFIYSFRNLKNRKLRTWLTMIGVVIGIFSIVALIGLGNGLRTAVRGQFDFLSPDIITVSASSIVGGPPGQGATNPIVIDYVDDIERLSAVDFAIGIMVRSVKFEFNRVQTISFVRSMPSSPQKQRELARINNLEIEYGRDIRPGEKGKVVLGSNFRTRRAVYGRNINVGNKVLINDVEFEVVGILERRGSFIIDNIIIVDEDELRVLVDDFETYSSITVKAKSLGEVDRARDQIYNYMSRERRTKEGKEDFSISTAESSLNNINNILNGIQIFVLVIATISMIVGSIGVVNTMFTAVLERTKEIGIMKAIGAKNSHIFKLFLIESGLLGLVGGILGIILGWFVAVLGTRALSNLLNRTVSPSISVSFVILLLVGSFVLGAISGIIPAMQAANMKPVNALRGS